MAARPAFLQALGNFFVRGSMKEIAVKANSYENVSTMDVLERAHLRILVAIQEQGSLTKAGRQLGLTQSALSHAIKKMEHELDVSVYERRGRALRLTQAGEYLLECAQRILPQFEQAERALRQYGQGQRGNLRLGIECHPCFRWLLRVLSPYLEEFPDVDVDVKQRFQFGGVGALYAHEIDLLITPDPIQRKGLGSCPVFDYEHVLVVGKNHPLRNHSYVRPMDLEKETLLTYPVEVERLDVFAQFLLPAGCSPRHHKVVEATEILLMMVERGGGVGALPRWLVEEYQAEAQLYPVRLGARGIHKKIHIMTRGKDAELAHIKAFLRMARTFRPPGGRGTARRPRARTEPRRLPLSGPRSEP